MGDLLRQSCALMARAALYMTFPTLVAAYLLIIVFWPYFPGSVDENRYALAAVIFVTHIVFTLCYYTYLATNRQYRIQRLDGELVGREFGGMRKKDRKFCKALQYLVDDAVMDALELFASLEEEELTKNESRLVHFYLGRCYQMTACPSNAICHYTQAQEKGLETPYLDLFLARSYTDSGRYEEALRTYRILLDKNPADFQCVRTDIGMMFLRERDGEQALKWFRESMDLGENYVFAIGGCSLAYLLLGDEEKSQEYYEKAVAGRMGDMEGFKQFYKELEETVQQRKSASKECEN